MKVLHVSAAGVYGGNEEHLRTLFAHLDRRKIETHLAAPAESSLYRKAKDLGVEVHALHIRKATDLRAAWKLKKLVSSLQADILHTHNRWEDGIGFALAELVPTLKWVTTLHDRLNMDQQGNRVRTKKARLYCRMLRRAALVMVNSRATTKDAIEEAGLDPKKVLTITNGQDLSRLDGVKPVLDRLPAGWKTKDAVRVGLFARVRGTAIQKKGIPEFVQAADIVLRAGANATFAVVGADEKAAEAIQWCADECMLPPDSWAVLPFAQDPRGMMKACDVVVCPSRFEGLPRSLMEAMGLGRAVVGTRVDGIGEIIEQGKSGLLVPPQDPEALAKAILKLVKDGKLRIELGEGAAVRVRRDYGAERMAREHEEAYAKVMG